MWDTCEIFVLLGYCCKIFQFNILYLVNYYTREVLYCLLAVTKFTVAFYPVKWDTSETFYIF